MTSDPRFAENQIDSLVRQYLDIEARDVDVPAQLRAIAARDSGVAMPGLVPTSRSPVTQPRQPSRHRHWNLAVAAGMLLTIGVISYLYLPPEPASAYALVTAAESELARKPVDRCYQVETLVPKAWRRGNPFLQDGDESRVWTRGDRFRVLTTEGGRQYQWGQDGQRRLWVVCDEQHALRFDRDEVPPMFARTRAYLGLDVRRLANRFLRDYDLRFEKRRDADDRRVSVVHATIKPDRPPQPFNAARLEIDPKTKVVRSLELARVVDGQTKAQFRFTLVESSPERDSSYEVESHLAAGAKILDREHAAERERLLRELVESRR